MVMNTNHSIHGSPKQKLTTEDTGLDIRAIRPNFAQFFLIVGTVVEHPMSRVLPMKGHLMLKATVGTVNKVIRQPNGNLIVGLEREGQVANLLKIKQSDTAPVQLTPHKAMNTKGVVIHIYAPHEIMEAEIVEGLADEGVAEVRKLYFT